MLLTSVVTGVKARHYTYEGKAKGHPLHDAAVTLMALDYDLAGENVIGQDPGYADVAVVG